MRKLVAIAALVMSLGVFLVLANAKRVVMGRFLWPSLLFPCLGILALMNYRWAGNILLAFFFCGGCWLCFESLGTVP